jgi:hypothetical protein
MNDKGYDTTNSSDSERFRHSELRTVQIRFQITSPAVISERITNDVMHENVMYIWFVAYEIKIG